MRSNFKVFVVTEHVACLFVCVTIAIHNNQFLFLYSYFFLLLYMTVHALYLSITPLLHMKRRSEHGIIQLNNNSGLYHSYNHNAW